MMIKLDVDANQAAMAPQTGPLSVVVTEAIDGFMPPPPRCLRAETPVPVRVLGLAIAPKSVAYALLEMFPYPHAQVRLLEIEREFVTTTTELLSLPKWLHNLIESAQPHVIVMEDGYMPPQAQDAFLIGQIHSVCLLSLTPYPLAWYRFGQVREALTGHSNSTFEGVRLSVERRLGVSVRPHSNYVVKAIALSLMYVLHPIPPSRAPIVPFHVWPQ